MMGKAMVLLRIEMKEDATKLWLNSFFLVVKVFTCIYTSRALFRYIIRSKFSEGKGLPFDCSHLIMSLQSQLVNYVG